MEDTEGETLEGNTLAEDISVEDDFKLERSAGVCYAECESCGA